MLGHMVRSIACHLRKARIIVIVAQPTCWIIPRRVNCIASPVTTILLGRNNSRTISGLRGPGPVRSVGLCRCAGGGAVFVLGGACGGSIGGVTTWSIKTFNVKY